MGNQRSNLAKAKHNISLSEKEIEFLIKNTNFNRVQIQEWYSSFLEECPDGLIKKRNLISTYQKIYPEGRVDSFCSILFNALDRDSCGIVDFFDFIQSVSLLMEKDVSKKLPLVFRIFDMKRIGEIDFESINKVVSSIFELLNKNDVDSKHKSMNIFKRFNKSLNETISEQEFINGCLNDRYLIELLIPF